MAFIADGYLNLSEYLGIIGLYIAFVSFAISRAKNAESERPAAETNNVQFLEGHEELSESIVEVSDEDRPT